MRTALLFGRVLVVASAFGLVAPDAAAIVVESTSASVQVIENATPTFVIEDPSNGTTYLECSLVEWRDCEGSAGSPEWSVSGTTDGSATQTWLRDSSASMTTTTTVPSTAVAIHLEGDSNDGRCRLLVDGSEVAVIDMYDAGFNHVIVIVRDLGYSTHTLAVDDIGVSTHGGSEDDVAVWGGSALACGSPVPTLSEWGLISLGVMLLTGGVFLVLRRTQPGVA